MSSAKLPASVRISFLDVLRVFAFVSVLVGHEFYPALADASRSQDLPTALRLLAAAVLPLCRGGGVGVVVFFLISGYIITHVILRESTLAFSIKRIFRIYPLYVVAVLSEAGVNHAVHGTPWPSWAALLPRLTLTGDFFGIPYALMGVEWTLRIEVAFYALMALLRYAGLLARPERLPAVYLALTIALQVTGPWFTTPGLATGYVTLYAPFLFLGSSWYLAERRLARLGWCTFCPYIDVLYMVLLPRINPIFAGAHFATYAGVVFFVAWKLRSAVHPWRALTWLSELTYPVYLFHKWVWPHLDRLIGALDATAAYREMKILVLLLVLCTFAYHAVERPFIRLGAWLSGGRG